MAERPTCRLSLHMALLEIAHELGCPPDMRNWRDTGSEFAMVYGTVHSVTAPALPRWLGPSL